MNGLELVRRIRQDARLCATPLIIVSYKDRDEDRRAGLDAGANAYLTKSSFQDASFLTTVADMLGES
jgi:two-component system, chemotaxis family, sensor histidine kinase and response regulator WspE